MKNYYLIPAVASILFGLFVLAQNEEIAGITFPVAELGNCKNKADCETYCDKPENMFACLNFAEAHNLIPEEEAKMARKMLKVGEEGGPGGCRGKIECGAYCDNPDHMEECIIFAKKYGLIPPDELEDVEKVLAAIKKGAKPPACHGKAACDAYCNLPEHFEECITFGEAAGLIPPDEIESAKKALEAVKKGVKPPACKGKIECDAYCGLPEHLEECLTFAEAAGFISPEEAAMARKTGGKGPGGCRGKEECEAYCEEPTHMEVCIDFGVEYGFMSAEEAENAKKMLRAGFTAGPGGCKGKEACEAYCNDLVHLEECVDFGEKMGFMSSEDAERARRMAQRGINVMQGGPGGCKGEEECRAFCENPANAEECLNFAVQIGEMTVEEAEQAKKGMEMMQKGGPGGCKSEEACKAYCDDPSHTEECINFSVEQGLMSAEEAQQMLEMMRGGPPAGMPSEGLPAEGMPPGMGPEMPISPGFPSQFEGKCTNSQECIQYCLQNPQDSACQAVMPGYPSEGSPQAPQLPGEMMTPTPGEISPPPEGTLPPTEEITPPPPPTETLPQSLFELAKKFLASLIAIFKIK